MNCKEKLVKLEEVMDMEEGTLTPDDVLADMSCWDSMTRLSLIVMMDDEFSKTLSGDMIRSFKTVQDILDYMV